MPLTYHPGPSPAHRVDPRAKLLFQVTFGVAAFAHTRPGALVALTGLAGLSLLGAALSPLRVVREYRFLLPFLVGGPALQALTVGPPWVAPARAVSPALASYRVLLVLAVSAAYVRTTSARESRAAVQHLLPGKAGQFLGAGAAFVLRFLPTLRADLASVRRAMRARLASERPLTDRMRLVAASGLGRALERADRFGLALRARCFAWNPTLPALELSARDLPILATAVALAVWSATALV